MARFVVGMNQTLDGYVDHTAFAPGPILFRHFIDEARLVTGAIYGRRLYEIMAYWETDSDDWGPDEREFAEVWRRQHKWVVSRTLTSVGPNATLVASDIEGRLRRLKQEHEGSFDIAGTHLVHSLTESGLIDLYRVYLHPVVLGSGTPYFAGARPALRLVEVERMAEDVVRLGYQPA